MVHLTQSRDVQSDIRIVDREVSANFFTVVTCVNLDIAKWVFVIDKLPNISLGLYQKMLTVQRTIHGNIC